MGLIKKVAVGLSGGVDSAVSAALLKQKGFTVIGVFMKNWDETEETGTCTISDDRSSARSVCRRLEIAFHEVEFIKEYWVHVFSYLLQGYERGITPNPDVMCNKHIKFDLFQKYCLQNLDVDAVATGHYAKTNFGSFLENYNEAKPVKLLQPRDKFKDQTFFLSQVLPESLKKAIFPLSNLLKSEVKEIAAKYEMTEVLGRRESAGICFIGKRKFEDFLSEYMPNLPGPLIDVTSGKTLQSHNGLHLRTVGQSYIIQKSHIKYFVCKKDVSENVMYLAPGTIHPTLYSFILYTKSPHWISASLPISTQGLFTCHFRFQHTKPTVSCQVYNLRSGGLLVLLERPLKAITPGQFAVFYKNQECLGSAAIQSSGPSLFSLGKNVPLDYREYEHFPHNTT